MAKRLLKLRDVTERCALSRSALYQKVSEGEFPAPIKLGRRAVAWLDSDIDEWIGERIAASRGV